MITKFSNAYEPRNELKYKVSIVCLMIFIFGMSLWSLEHLHLHNTVFTNTAEIINFLRLFSIFYPLITFFAVFNQYTVESGNLGKLLRFWFVLITLAPVFALSMIAILYFPLFAQALPLILASLVVQLSSILLHHLIVNNGNSIKSTIIGSFFTTLISGVLAVPTGIFLMGQLNMVIPTISFNLLALCGSVIGLISLMISDVVYTLKIDAYNILRKENDFGILSFMKHQLLFIPFMLGNLFSFGYLERRLTDKPVKEHDTSSVSFLTSTKTPPTVANGNVYMNSDFQPTKQVEDTSDSSANSNPSNYQGVLFGSVISNPSNNRDEIPKITLSINQQDVPCASLKSL